METLSDGKTKVLAKLVGGEGTLGQMPWSPDGKKLVFVSYQLVPETP
jgi:Tol biopolymer transport system component